MREKIKQGLDYLLIGVLGFLPIALLFQIIIAIESTLKDFVLLVHGRYENPLITVMLFAAATGLLIYFGILLKHERAHLIYYFDSKVDRIPILGSVYSVIRKLLNMFVGKDDMSIRKVVYVEYPKDGMWVPAYVTNRIDNFYVLYVPTSPNPTSGFTVIVDQAKVVDSNMDIEQVSSFVMSVGVDYDLPAEVQTLQEPDSPK